MKIDFHIHTKSSHDSIIRPIDLAAKSRKLGVIPAVTDHDSIGSLSAMRDLGAQFIPGEEVGTDRGDVIGLYISEHIPKKIPFSEALDRIHEQGGITYLPHMFDSTRAGIVPDNEDIPKIDIIETFNARSIMQSYNEKAEAFADKHRKLKAAGSDTHFLSEFGKTYTELPDFDLDNPKQLLRALKKAELVTSKAPIYVKGTTTLLMLGKKLLG